VSTEEIYNAPTNLEYKSLVKLFSDKPTVSDACSLIHSAKLTTLSAFTLPEISKFPLSPINKASNFF
jgi:hypothetical protein